MTPLHRRAEVTPVAEQVVVAALGTALAYATLAQGAYYAKGLVPVLVLVGVAALARMAIRHRTIDTPVGIAAGCLIALALWSLAIGSTGGATSDALPHVALACVLAIAMLSAHGLSDRYEPVLRLAIVSLGVAVAVSAWLGVVFHALPLALPSYDLWRGASTLTYANAAAAFLTITIVHAVAALPRGRGTNAVVAVMLVGLLSTMSRAGALALVVALVALAALTPDRARVRAILSAVVAAAVAGAALLPSVEIGSETRPLLPFIGVAAGAAVLMVAPRLRGRLHVGVALVPVVGLATVAVLHPSTRGVVTEIVTTRLNSVSAERGDLIRVTAEQFWSFPVTGVGPGQLNFRYIDHTGSAVRALYTHNEYLQLAAETGFVGLVLAVIPLGVLVIAGARMRTHQGAATAAVTIGFAVHSGFDFLWHIPVLPLLLVISIASLKTSHDPLPTSKGPVSHEEHAEDHR